MLSCGNVFADENNESDLSELEGFDEEIIIEEELPAKLEEERFKVSGDLAFKTSVGYIKHKVDGIEYSGINQAQTSLYLQFDTKLSDNWKMRISGNMYYDGIYDIYSGNNYSKDILDEYRTQARFDDVYIQGSLTSDLDLKLGRQIVVWGKSDTIRVTDVINPLDNRLPGVTDIEDLRLSVSMAKFDYYIKSWDFSFMTIFENRIMLEAPPNSEFFPVNSIFTTTQNKFIELKSPSNSFDDLQYAIAANGTFSGWDLSFYAAHVLDQKWHFDHVQGSVPLSKITRIVNKIDMLGSAINIASGNWLFKSEIAYLNGVGYNTTADEKNRLDILVGFDYTGFRDSVVSIEVANRHIFDYEAQMKNQADYVDKDEMQTAIRITRSFINETVNTTALIRMFGSGLEDGGFARVWLEYEIADALNTNFGVVNYIGGDKVFLEAIKNNDRVFADITYSF